MESTTDIDLFKKLLHYVEDEYAQFIDHGLGEIKEWKGQEIIGFQDHLRSKTGSTVSEKWFYTYVKNQPEKLPRVDILNLLCTYIDAHSWSAFAKAEKETIKAAVEHSHQLEKKESRKENWNHLFKSIAGFVIMACIYAGYNWWQSTQKTAFSICFYDQDRKSLITDLSVELVLIDGMGKTYHKADSTGCFHGEAASNKITLIARSSFHKNDTLIMDFDQSISRDQYLQTDDYALMLDYYSNNKVTAYKKRREQLDKLIEDNAIIMEVLPHSIGVTLYDKEDFINKLTTPTNSLKRLQIIDTKYQNEKITKLKFKIAR